MEYPSHELAAMAEARNYYHWILGQCRTRLGRVVLEHGAGIGTFSAFLAAEPIERLLALEPATNLIATLRSRLAPWGDKVEVVKSSLEECVSLVRGCGVDTIISINVLEHIPDDVATLRAMWEVLSEGGHVILFVPALPWLYGSLDRAFGHVRRYRRRELYDKISAAGFTIVMGRFMNFPGIASWLVTGRVLRRPTLDPLAVKAYDRYVIPIIAKLESLQAPPVGQNLLVIGQKLRARL
jgi:SAM-dependent methyltransferase